jgi:hypothetical protein
MGKRVKQPHVTDWCFWIRGDEHNCAVNSVQALGAVLRLTISPERHTPKSSKE